MSFVRGLENRIFGSVRSPAAAGVTQGEPGPWNVSVLRGHKYCLLASYRMNGKTVPTPVWFGIDGERLYVRSGARDGKVKRIRRNPAVLVAPCDARGKPTGPPMTGTARILAEADCDRAEAALRTHYGLGRMLYKLVRRRIEVAYLEVAGERESSAPA